MTHLVVEILNNPVCLGILSGSLIILPIIGIAKIHEPDIKKRSSRDD
jgi:hypothetical protein